MRAYPVDTPATGEFITPNEINAELAELVAAMDALDADNFSANAITRGKLADGCFGNLLIDRIETVRQIQHEAVDNTVVQYPMPNADGDPWIRNYSTGDCVLQCTLFAYFADQTTFEQLYLWIGLLLDGALVLQSPLEQNSLYRDCSLVEGNIPVGAGTHTLAVVYGMHSAALGSPRTIDWLDRMLSAREAAR